MTKKIKALLGYWNYRKRIAKEQKNYDKMVIAFAHDSNAVICGKRPSAISFYNAVKIIFKG